MTSTSLAHIKDKNVILRLEATGYESDRASSSDGDDPFHRLNLTQGNPNPKYGAVSAITYDLLPRGVELAQDLSGGCGGKTWEAADIMIDYLLWKNQQQDDLFDGKKVLELGAGTGLVGLALALGCSKLNTMVLTDQIPMMALMRQNIALNQVNDKVQAAILDWGEPISESCRAPDIVLASDCVYLEVAFKPLLDTLVALADNHTTIYMSYRKRRNADKKFFIMARKHFTFTEVMDDPKRDTYTRNRMKLYLMRKK